MPLILKEPVGADAQHSVLGIPSDGWNWAGLPGSAAIGVVTVDMDAILAGMEARSVGGGYADQTLTGSWRMNSDSTGTLNAKRVRANWFASLLPGKRRKASPFRGWGYKAWVGFSE